MYDIISIGDATLDTLLKIHDAEVNCSLHNDRCMICVNYADKIPVDRLDRKVAGNAANNAVGSSRLGMKTAFYTILGNDGTGEFIMEKLKKEKVDLKYTIHDPKKETNSSFVMNYYGERTIFVYHAKRTYSLPKLDKTEWIYYTSLGPNHEKLNGQIINFVKKNKIKLGYNPGTYQLRAGFKQMEELLKVVEVLFVNKEEAARIVGAQHDVRHYLLALHKTGPKIVVITDGTNGSFCFDGEKFWQMDILNTPVVERTGAGDSFATAFIAALHYKKSIPEAMCWGTCNSSSVIMKYGPQDGLLTKTQMIAFHKKYKHVCPVNF
ncbi:MAG TPA: carbohydrate kinase family protein [Candidatus Magasanikbacteria bacterium]|nr:carbohydrate kinase family protein [Candidatus Magasanikbacteria bacterium]